MNGRRYNLKKGWERSTKLNKGAVKEFLLSHAVLSKWVGLTLVQRCAELQRMGLTVKRQCLTELYHKNKVSYVVVKYQYQQAAK